MSQAALKDYLGDGLQVEFDGAQFRLFTERDGGAIHEVYLDGPTLKNFLAFVEFVKHEVQL